MGHVTPPHGGVIGLSRGSQRPVTPPLGGSPDPHPTVGLDGSAEPGPTTEPAPGPHPVDPGSACPSAAASKPAIAGCALKPIRGGRGGATHGATGGADPRAIPGARAQWHDGRRQTFYSRPRRETLGSGESGESTEWRGRGTSSAWSRIGAGPCVGGVVAYCALFAYFAYLSPSKGPQSLFGAVIVGHAPHYGCSQCLQ